MKSPLNKPMPLPQPMSQPLSESLNETTDPILAASLSLVRWLVLSWLGLVVIGILAVGTPGALAAGNAVAFERAVFTSLNVATLSGLSQQFARVEDFSLIVRAIFVMQTLSGLLLSLIGGSILMARALRLPYSDSRISVASVILMALAMVVGVVARSPGDAVFDGAFFNNAMRGLSALACSGVSFNGWPGLSSLAHVSAFAPLSLIGAMGVLVVLEVFRAVTRAASLSAFAWRAICTVSITYVMGVGALTLLTHDALRASGVTLLALTGGMPIEWASDWPRAMGLVVTCIAIVGTGAGGVCGGVGAAYFFTLGRRSIRVVAVCFVTQIIFIVCALMILLSIEPTLSFERAQFLCVSAAMGLGLSHEPVSVTGGSLHVLSGLLITSRLLPLVMLWLILRKRLGANSE